MKQQQGCLLRAKVCLPGTRSRVLRQGCVDTCKATFEALRVLKHCGGAGSGHQIPSAPSQADVRAETTSLERGQTQVSPRQDRFDSSGTVLRLTRQIPQPRSAQQTPGNISTARLAQSAAHPRALSIFIRANCFSSETHPPRARGGRWPLGTACGHAYKRAGVIQPAAPRD